MRSAALKRKKPFPDFEKDVADIYSNQNEQADGKNQSKVSLFSQIKQSLQTRAVRLFRAVTESVSPSQAPRLKSLETSTISSEPNINVHQNVNSFPLSASPTQYNTRLSTSNKLNSAGSSYDKPIEIVSDDDTEYEDSAKKNPFSYVVSQSCVYSVCISPGLPSSRPTLYLNSIWRCFFFFFFEVVVVVVVLIVFQIWIACNLPNS